MTCRFLKFLLALALFIVPSFVFSQSYSYSKRNGNIFYDGIAVHGVDAGTFRDLGFGYGKDRYHVYRYGVILEYVDPSSFRVDRRYSANNGPSHGFPGEDGYHAHGRTGYYVSSLDVFYNGEKISGASKSSFEILKDEYAKDAFGVYWMGKKISGASSSSFVCLGKGYAKDAFSVYWRGHEIKGASSSSFKVTKGYYAEDAFDTYFKGEKLK